VTYEGRSLEKRKARARSTPEARLGRRDAADVLGDLVPEGPREGAARPEGVGEPDARRVALLVELRAEVALPDLVQGHAALDLADGQDAAAHALHALPLVDAVAGLVHAQRRGRDAARARVAAA